MFDGSSPAVRRFGIAPNPRPPDYTWPADSRLQSFALAATTHQPFAYLWTTLEGVVKYVAPSIGGPTMIGWSQAQLIPGLHDPSVEAAADAEVASYYPHHPIIHHSLRALDAYAKAARVEGPLTAVLLLLMVAGFLLARGPRAGRGRPVRVDDGRDGPRARAPALSTTLGTPRRSMARWPPGEPWDSASCSSEGSFGSSEAACPSAGRAWPPGSIERRDTVRRGRPQENRWRAVRRRNSPASAALPAWAPA